MYKDADFTLHKKLVTVNAKINQKCRKGLKVTFIKAAAFIGNREYPRVHTELKNPLIY